MSHRFPQHYRDPDLVRWSDVSGIWVLFGVALLIGLVSGGVWIVWRLIDLHLLQ